MLVLGLDPGLATMGYGLIEGDGRTLQTIAYGVLRTPAKLATSDRLMLLHQELTTLLNQYRPNVAAVEELFYSTNARTAILVGEARGAMLLTLAEAGIVVAEYTPLQVKQAITGYGGADKVQMQEMVRLLLGLSEKPHPDDAADALAISIWHHHSTRLNTLLGKQPGGR